MQKQKAIVVVGSINIDLVSVTRRIPAVGETVLGRDFQVHPGGKGANQAVAVARLGYPVRMLGRLGNDAFGAQLKRQLDEVGVDTNAVAISEGSSGVASITVSDAGENSIVVTPGANGKLTPDDIEANIAMIREAGVVLTQLEIPIETVDCLAGICAREKVPLILDPAPVMELPTEIFPRIAWFTPNETESSFYVDNKASGEQSAQATADALLARGTRSVILKLGANGVFVAAQREKGTFVPPFRVKAVDTTAAGDAFNGGFATALMLGNTPTESARFAAAVAAISVTREGAQPSMPTRAEVDQLLAAQPEA